MSTKEELGEEYRKTVTREGAAQFIHTGPFLCMGCGSPLRLVEELVSLHVGDRMLATQMRCKTPFCALTGMTFKLPTQKLELVRG